MHPSAITTMHSSRFCCDCPMATTAEQHQSWQQHQQAQHLNSKHRQGGGNLLLDCTFTSTTSTSAHSVAPKEQHTFQSLSAPSTHTLQHHDSNKLSTGNCPYCPHSMNMLINPKLGCYQTALKRNIHSKRCLYAGRKIAAQSPQACMPANNDMIKYTAATMHGRLRVGPLLQTSHNLRLWHTATHRTVSSPICLLLVTI